MREWGQQKPQQNHQEQQPTGGGGGEGGSNTHGWTSNAVEFQATKPFLCQLIRRGLALWKHP